MPEPGFKPRELVVVHEELWQAIEELAEDLNCRIVRVMSTGGELDTYILSPQHLLKE